MPIILAKSAGFCFGVKRAVDMTCELLRQGKPVCLLGELIHNRQVTRELCSLGARTVASPEECGPEDVLVLRAHGAAKEVLEEIDRSGIACCNATCPYVTHIQQIVAQHSLPGALTIIAGNPNHPEVVGIRSYAQGEVVVVQSADELEFLLTQAQNSRDLGNLTVIAVAQTTFLAEEWKKSLKIMNFLCTNAKIFDTICYATQLRQEEAQTLAQSCDAMVVIGDQLSSNTGKLLAVCKELCPSFLVEGSEGLLQYQTELSSFRTIGCTAGASTPARTIREVLQRLEELQGSSTANSAATERKV